MDDRKKRTAAIAAVMSYLRAEEEAVSMQAALGMPPVLPSAPSVPLKLWGISGRQIQMQMRNLMQLKSFHR